MNRLILVMLAADARISAPARWCGPQALEGAWPGTFRPSLDASRAPDAPSF